MSRQLLIDILPIKIEPSSLQESANRNDGRCIIKNMIIQRANTPNRNRRVYSESILEREMRRIMDSVRKVEGRGLIGELDHPESNVINLKNACLGVLDYRWKGNEVMGDVEVLNTPSGRILREIIEAGYVPGISSRGLGSVKQLYEQDDPDLVEVDDDFELLTYDAVSDPSSHNAYFKSVNASGFTPGMNESYQNKPNRKYESANGIIREILCELNGQCCWK